MQSRKIKDFYFAIFYNKTKSHKKKQNNIITTKEICIRNRKQFTLRNEESIINK